MVSCFLYTTKLSIGLTSDYTYNIAKALVFYYESQYLINNHLKLLNCLRYENDNLFLNTQYNWKQNFKLKKETEAKYTACIIEKWLILVDKLYNTSLFHK